MGVPVTNSKNDFDLHSYSKSTVTNNLEALFIFICNSREYEMFPRVSPEYVYSKIMKKITNKLFICLLENFESNFGTWITLKEFYKKK